MSNVILLLSLSFQTRYKLHVGEVIDLNKVTANASLASLCSTSLHARKVEQLAVGDWHGFK